MPLEVNGVQAWITVENKVQVQEYAPEIDEATGVATCWIGAEPGQTFAIRWRESDLLDPTRRIYHRDISGFVTMDGYELGGRVLQARSHASAIFSRIATSPTHKDAQMYTFSGIGADWKTLGTISLDIHVVEVGEANRLHEGFSSYYRRDEGSPLSSATPFSSTEVSSIRKIATFIFKYRPLDVLQYHGIAPAPLTYGCSWVHEPNLGDKRSASDSDDDDDIIPESPDSPTLMFGNNSGTDSDSSQDYVRKLRPRRTLKNNYFGPHAKRMRI
ncbi:hypothetical protein M413DRAFT_22709 [Hebeloma cylindrosporum]|uniref:Uncharacterized protein n=1 Tax=Hebeloma cylindrosporum TaxID=76867 RepID=A0A0C2YEI3_HEBCY|nr:hypothetical protein M413DRAFT_22709 [Hebeloma cylindrosporum h7]